MNESSNLVGLPARAGPCGEPARELAAIVLAHAVVPAGCLHFSHGCILHGFAEAVKRELGMR